MTEHRFFVNRNQIRGEKVILSGSQARQAHSVLRLRKGDCIRILDNQGWQYEVQFLTVNPQQATGRILTKSEASGEPAARLTLYQSLLKQDKFEWILQKGTELGVLSFVPLVTERTIVRPTKLKQNKMARWQRIIREAAEQAGRGRIPTLSQPVQFVDALVETQSHDMALIPWENESERTLSEPFMPNNQLTLPLSPTVALFIGPEGGFTQKEVAHAQTANMIAVTLGPRILRAETAAIVATALILNELGEMK
ncbi:MAG: 16S rRNA (uracil(1498)-N(3))-methyltransferase [Chloroflexi bacterium]|jgi:16S rRNA (uracil1498-N3)-methyltransferase|nr:16S rRNA (uracil(1498)-N(3))-methyltransferase [Chloroflexota bacterium]